MNVIILIKHHLQKRLKLGKHPFFGFLFLYLSAICNSEPLTEGQFSEERKEIEGNEETARHSRSDCGVYRVQIDTSE